MNILDADIGNSRLKWRLSHSGSESVQGVISAKQTGEEAAGNIIDEIYTELLSAGLSPERVRVSSVRGAIYDREIEKEILLRWDLHAEFAKTCRSFAGVTNAYKDVTKMGVDRWLAVLAAFSSVSESVVVVDCGSALTVDFVNCQGKHLGGYITPGLQMMLDSMTSRSSALRLDENNEWSRISPGIDTSQAMRQGVLSMTCGWLTQLREEYSEYRWVLTGGDASVIIPQLDFEVIFKPELVLDGLSLLLP